MSSSTRTTSTRSFPRADIAAVADRDPPRPFLSFCDRRAARPRPSTFHGDRPMAHAAAEIGAGTPYVREVEQAHLASAMGPLQAHHADAAAADGYAVPLAMARDRRISAPCGRRSADRGHRTPRADHVASLLRRRDRDHRDHARRLHRARSGRAGPPPSPHRRCHPICNPGRRRRHPRQRTLVRHEDRRSDPDTADGVARPHQSQQEPDRLVRRRQHAAAARAQRAFLRTGRSEERGFLEGGRRRRTSLARSRTCGCQCPDRSAQFTEIPLSG